MPVVNVVLPANYSLSPVITVPPPAPLLKKLTGLIPSALNEGPRMDINTFCVIYLLPDAVLQHFHENAITGTHVFSHITDTDLTQMSFKIREVIDLKEGGRQDVGVVQGKFLNPLSFVLTIAFLPFYCCCSAL